MPGLDAMELQRLLYRQGQMLLSQDLRDEAAFTAQRRWWHNRALHQAFGVADGFQVQLELHAQRAFVVVSRGLAYDCFGRELISQREQRLEIPAADPSSKQDALVLLVRYRDTSTFEPGAELNEACLPNSCSLFEERPDFICKSASKVQPKDGVPLAQVIYQGGLPTLDDAFHAPQPRPLAKPLLANGATIAGATAWQVWSILTGRFLLPIGLQVRIDTSRAGFTDVPCYFAWLQVPSLEVTAANVLFLGLIGWHAEYVMEATDKAFTFRLFFPLLPAFLLQNHAGFEGKDALAAIGAFLLGFAQQQQLYTCWLGIQPQPGPVQSSVNEGVSDGKLS